MYLPPGEDWERLPWLAERPLQRRRRRQLRGRLVTGLCVLLLADAAASYSAGRLGAERDRLAEKAVTEDSRQSGTVAAHIEQASDFAWQRREANAPY